MYINTGIVLIVISVEQKTSLSLFSVLKIEAKTRTDIPLGILKLFWFK